MGACGSGKIEKLGPQFSKFVAIDKAQDFFKKQMDRLKKQVREKADDWKKQADKLIDEREEGSIKRMKETEEEIEKQKPGQLDKAASLQHKSVNEILGEPQIKQQFQKVRKDVDKEFEQKYNEIQDKMQKDYEQHNQDMQTKKPGLPTYQSLPEKERKNAYNKGQKTYKNEIKEQQRETNEFIEDKMNVEKYIKEFEDIELNEKLQKAEDKVQDILKDAKKMGKSKFLFC